MSRRILVAVLCGLLTTAGLAALSAPADAAVPRRITFTAPATVVGGSTYTVAGTVSRTPRGSTVLVQRASGTSWVTAARATTRSNGTYTVTIVAKSSGPVRLRARAAAARGLHTATSGARTVTVLQPRRLTFGADNADVVEGQAITFAGRTQPGTGGATVQLEVASAGSWKTVDVGTTAADGGFTFSRAPAEGRWRYRVVTPRQGTAAAATSSPVEVVVTTPPPPVAFTRTPAPVVSGVPEPGSRLVADPGDWAPAPDSFTYEWRRNGVPIAGSDASYLLTAADVGAEVSVRVSGHRPGYVGSSVSTPIRVRAPEPEPEPEPPAHVTTFGDLMRPSSTRVVDPATATIDYAHADPPFGAATGQVRWDTPGAFTHSLTPHADLTRWSSLIGQDVRAPERGAEYLGGNDQFKNADVEFSVTGRRFALRYLTYTSTDAMVWIDNRPVAATPIRSTDETDIGTFNWVVVTLPERRTVQVRFAGPQVFTGVDFDESDPVTVTAVEPRLTLGVLSDSYYERSPDPGSASRSAAPVLRSLTGFRVWNMSEGGTGYVAEGPEDPADPSSPYGSPERLDALVDAPIDALLINGGLNDQRFDPAEQRAAVDRLLTEVARRRPGLPVVIVGIEPVSWGNPDQALPVHVALTRNLQDMAALHPNVVGFIDPYTENWLTGTGSTAHPTGDGNQDRYVGRDQVHLNGDGQEYYQGRIVDQLRDLPATLG